MIAQLLPKGRQVSLDNSGKIAHLYLEGQKKTHVVHQVFENSVMLKSLNAEKYRELYDLDVHYLVSNDTGGYNSKVFSHRHGY